MTTDRPLPTVAPPGSIDPAADQLSGQLLEIAVALSLKAGRTVVEMRHEAVESATSKSTPTDPVTVADKAAEAIVVDGILRYRPDDGLVGEEGANRLGSSSVTWYIDPIDGTTNYLYDIPAYAVSIAAAINGNLVAGVVHNPSTGELFVARAGHGAQRNGEAIQLRPKVETSSALVATGFGYSPQRRQDQAEVLHRVLPSIRDIRRFGSAALDLCALAMGRVDGYYEVGLNIWDYAAGWLIAGEAGGVCRNLQGGDPSSDFFIAGRSDLVASLVRLIDPPPSTG